MPPKTEKTAPVPVKPKGDPDPTAKLIKELAAGVKTEGQARSDAEVKERVRKANLRRAFHDAEERIIGVAAASKRSVLRQAQGIDVADMPVPEYNRVVDRAAALEAAAPGSTAVKLTVEQLTAIPSDPGEVAQFAQTVVAADASSVESGQGGEEVIGS